MAAGKRKKQTVFRFHNGETGEFYTIRLTKNAYEKMGEKPVMKYSRKLKKHAEFKVVKPKLK